MNNKNLKIILPTVVLLLVVLYFVLSQRAKLNQSKQAATAISQNETQKKQAQQDQDKKQQGPLAAQTANTERVEALQPNSSLGKDAIGGGQKNRPQDLKQALEAARKYRANNKNGVVQRSLTKKEAKNAFARRYIEMFKNQKTADTNKNQQKFFSESRTQINVPEGYKSLYTKVENVADMLFNYNDKKGTSFKVITKNGKVNSSDMQELEENMLGFKISDFDEVALPNKITQSLNGQKLYMATRETKTTWVYTGYDEKKNKSVAMIFDGLPKMVYGEHEKILEVVNTFSFSN